MKRDTSRSKLVGARIPLALFLWLNAKAIATNRSVSDVINEALERLKGV